MKKLSKDAYGGIKGQDYKPYVADGKNRKNGGGLIILFGILLSVIFAASTAYSGMKVGLTVAAGIPGSIIGSGLVSMFVKSKNILSKNILSGMSSGGESIASGMIFVLPAIILIGGKINFLEGVLVGITGVLFSLGATSLVQNYLLVEEHGNLVYPEAMAIAESLVASDAGGDSLKNMGIGFGISGVLTALTSSVFGLVNNTISYVSEGFYKSKMEIEANPMLSGIGFIVGFQVAMTMFAGSLLTNFVLIPLIGYFTSLADSSAAVWDVSNLLVKEMTVNNIASSYAKYIGAGMMISGGLIGAIKLIPTIFNSISQTLKAKSSSQGGNDASGMMVLLAGTVMTFIMGFVISKDIVITLVGSLVSLILSLLFAIVSGRLTGTIGTSNLPVSGMTIASLVIMTLVFVMMGWKSEQHNIILLLFATFVVIVIAVAGSYMQAQKATFVMGGSSTEMMKYFLISGVVGVITVVGVISLLAPQIAITGEDAPFAVPQANLMATLTSGIMQGKLPWLMIIVGVALGIVFFLLDLSVMSIAVGAYLPIATTSIILIGALVRVFVERASKEEKVKEERLTNGISLSSGLIAGGSIIGLVGIILQITGVVTPGNPTGIFSGNSGGYILLIGLLIASLIPIMKVKGSGGDVDNESKKE
ncbi:oligopeptide transporter, OPT family [Vagococcus carniphilus]|uniref:Oligopeptide transporter, OPT family n=1 Tax=Vagococcus carniphilus TaxID=218144 RepID=A0AAW8U2P8_9ENTE|nr:oligopeptide transporter, OPT family [Vagococcus carniphilus]MDT2830390.1 oligopeptide transporter, OPT family [Vagococcus carniphilus]MDT2832425.1 oligopeptide transporter, OPT family [Vagococcus carniphilus]MDT2840041.1 oligopeptide transporter, OPT family [Vagococcus carniphilus]MDT2854532.1 oligopeptide transporter, OPT family [Vagococcus carniphilus]